MPDKPEMLHYAPPRRLKLAGLVAGGAAITVLIVGTITRVTASHDVAAWTDANALPTVSVINLGASDATRDLVFPGTIAPINNAPIYARVSGYLKKWYVDIGTPVKAGQLLAEIDVPDQDQQLAQAKADLGTAIANQRLSAQIAARWNRLAKVNAAAPQDVDEKNGDLAAKNAAAASAKANVDRLNDLENFKRIVAPFDGMVTSRAVDEGALVNVGTQGATPLFTVEDDSRVRIYVNIPQGYSAEIRPGMKASFTVPEYPGQTFAATLVASAQSVSAQTGAVLVQLQADNADRKLKAGDYAQVKLDLPAGRDTVRVPASALISGDDGTEIAVLGQDGRVAIKPVTVVRDLGTAVEIASGLTHRDRVIDNPPDSLRQGDKVRVTGASSR